MHPNLLKLYLEFDSLYRDIKLVCKNCHDHDCEGYVWLLANEVESLLNIDVSIVEINDSTAFIHSFEEEGGVIRVDKPKPPCQWRDSGLCSIYENRPLVCRMYPVGFVTDNNEVVVALHRDCEYSRRLEGESKKQFFNCIIKILRQTSVDLLNEIFDCYLRVDHLSAFPEGLNTFEAIVPLKVILNERR